MFRLTNDKNLKSSNVRARYINRLNDRRTLSGFRIDSRSARKSINIGTRFSAAGFVWAIRPVFGFVPKRRVSSFALMEIRTSSTLTSGADCRAFIRLTKRRPVLGGIAGAKQENKFGVTCVYVKKKKHEKRNEKTERN